MNFIPAQIYGDVYLNVMLVIMLLTFMHTLQFYHFLVIPKTSKIFAFILLISIILFIGNRPIDKFFEDMIIYANDFKKYADGHPVTTTKDAFFQHFIKLSSEVMNITSFFILCASIYIIPMYYVCKKIFGNYFFWPFFLHITSFSFWGYGTNGIRNGIATSLLLIAITLKKKHISILILFYLSFLIHASSIIPIVAYLISVFHKTTRHYLWAWAICIVLSAVFGNYFSTLIAGMGFEDQRAQEYLISSAEQLKSKFSGSGFRIDFLIYSSIGIAAGYYYVFVKGFTDEIYIRLYNIYITANAFWILVIRVAFSNRFAYLSWFMMALIISYPLFKTKIWDNQYNKIVVIIICYFSFTYLMNFLK